MKETNKLLSDFYGIRKLLAGMAVCVLTLVSTSTFGQSGSFASINITKGGEMAIFGEHNFTTGSGIYSGLVGTDRDSSVPGYLSFTTTGSWQNANTNAHVDGYVRCYHTGGFVFPVGDNGTYNPVGLSSVGGDANVAYYNADPTMAITDRIDGIDYGALPGGSTFNTDSVEDGIGSVNNSGYWDINSSNSAIITLSWNLSDDMNTFTSGNIQNLTIVGWDGSKWVQIESTVDATAMLAGQSTLSFAGSSSIVDSGTISTDAALIPNTFEVYALAEIGDVCLSAKAYLQGALISGSGTTMSDHLRSNNLIPLTEPYTSLTAFSHAGNGGGETTTTTVLSVTGNDAIVDWVMIELRDTSNSSTVLETQSALIQRDGDIVSTDGTSALCFSSPVSDSVYVSVRHRNHFGIMAANPIQLTSSGKSLDFSTVSLFGTNAAASQSGVNAMWVGDVNYDESILYEGSGNDVTEILNIVLAAPGNTFLGGSQGFNYSGVYSMSDINMDGDVKYEGTDNDVTEILNVILSHPSNTFFGGSQGFSGLTQQLP